MSSCVPPWLLATGVAIDEAIKPQTIAPWNLCAGIMLKIAEGKAM
jgi:hypothetical protein